MFKDDNKINLEAFYKSTLELLESIEDCLSKQYILPCLALVYVGIDVMASLEKDPKEGVKTSFTRWVDNYILKEHHLECTALELYSARCGIVHTFSSDSDILQKGKARRVLYAWGSGEPDQLDARMAQIGKDNCITVHIRDLIEGLRHGIVTHQTEIEKSPERQELLSQRTGMWLSNIDKSEVSKALRAHMNKENT